MQAGIRCSDPRFREFLEQQYGEPIAFDDSANVVRVVCNVKSRSEFDADPIKGGFWGKLNAEFEEWAGYLPEQR